MVVGLVVPPRTVGSLAITRHWVCATSASATTTPPPTGSPVCRPASGHSSSTGVPGSTRASRRSRTIILPRARWRSTYCGPPPARTSSCSPRTSSARARMASVLAVNSSLAVERRDRSGVLTAVVSQAGRRFSKNAAMPSAASAPAKSSAEVRGGRGQALGPPADARRPRSSDFVARTAPGAAWRSASRLGGHPGVEGGLVVNDRREQAGAGRLSRASKRSPVSVMRARNRGSITRRAGTKIMAGATPTRTSVKANVLASAATARSDAAISPSPPARACPLTRAMTGTGLSTMHVRIVGHPVGRRTTALGEVGAGAEHRARARQDDGSHLRVARCVTQRLIELRRGGGPTARCGWPASRASTCGHHHSAARRPTFPSLVRSVGGPRKDGKMSGTIDRR